jgi:hypothetical protein
MAAKYLVTYSPAGAILFMDHLSAVKAVLVVP